MSDWIDTPAIGIGVALGAGLLIGLDRERRKGSGAGRGAAGVRTFAIAALAGAVAQTLGQPLLVALGAAAVVALAAIAYWAGRRRGGGDADDDPGLTTELALVVTYLVGVLAVAAPALGAAVAAIVAALLAGRERLHRFATGLITEAELHDAVLLAALALVLLPLLPGEPQRWLGGLAPRPLLWVLLLILGVQAAGHVALRLFGARAGLALSGFLAGFVSSTVTIASMGGQARALAVQAAVAGRAERTDAAPAIGAILSTAATWVQALLLLLALAPVAAAALTPAALAALAVTLAAAWLVARPASLHGAWSGRTVAGASQVTTAAGSPTAAAPVSTPALPGAAPPVPNDRRPLRLREAALVALALSAAALLVAWAQRGFGTQGALAGTALAAVADAHAPIAALGALLGAGRAELDLVLHGTLLAIATNSVSRSLVAFVVGGMAYGLKVAAALAAAAAAAAAVIVLIG